MRGPESEPAAAPYACMFCGKPYSTREMLSYHEEFCEKGPEV